MFTHLTSRMQDIPATKAFDPDVAFFNFSLLEKELSTLSLLEKAIGAGADIETLMASPALHSTGESLFGSDCFTLPKDQFLTRLHNVQTMGNTLQIALCTKILSNVGIDPQSIGALEELSSTSKDEGEETTEIPTKKSIFRRYLRLLSRSVILFGLMGLYIHKVNQQKKRDAQVLREHYRKQDEAEEQRRREESEERARRQAKRAADRHAQEERNKDEYWKRQAEKNEKENAKRKEARDKFELKYGRTPGTPSPDDVTNLRRGLRSLSDCQTLILHSLNIGASLIDIKHPTVIEANIKEMEPKLDDAISRIKAAISNVSKLSAEVAQNRGSTQKELETNALAEAESGAIQTEADMRFMAKQLAATTTTMLAEYAKHSFVPESFKNTLKGLHDHAEKLISSPTIVNPTTGVNKQIGH